jgi:hypothetical protein
MNLGKTSYILLLILQILLLGLAWVRARSNALGLALQPDPRALDVAATPDPKTLGLTATLDLRALNLAATLDTKCSDLSLRPNIIEFRFFKYLYIYIYKIKLAPDLTLST